MQTMTLFTIAALLCMPAMAKDTVTTHQVHFDKGTTGTTVKGSVKGYDTVNYKLGAKAGQSMRVSLESNKVYMNIFEPGTGPGDTAMYRGSVEGRNYTGTLAKSGTYIIQVFLMRNEARRETSAPYTLHMGIDQYENKRKIDDKNDKR